MDAPLKPVPASDGTGATPVPAAGAAAAAAAKPAKKTRRGSVEAELDAIAFLDHITPECVF